MALRTEPATDSAELLEAASIGLEESTASGSILAGMSIAGAAKPCKRLDLNSAASALFAGAFNTAAQASGIPDRVSCGFGFAGLEGFFEGSGGFRPTLNHQFSASPQPMSEPVPFCDLHPGEPGWQPIRMWK